MQMGLLGMGQSALLAQACEEQKQATFSCLATGDMQAVISGTSAAARVHGGRPLFQLGLQG